MPWRWTPVLFVVAGLAGTQACTGPVRQASSSAAGDDTAGAGVDAGSTSPPAPEAAPYPAVAPSVPHVQSAGGAVLVQPRIVPVFFPGETEAATLTDAVAKYVASSAWKASTAEYGVAAAVMGTAVQSNDPLPGGMTTDALGAWITSHLDGTHPDWGAPDPSTIESTVYVLYPPAGTSLLSPQQDPGDPMAVTLCGPRWYDVTGWHWQTTPVPGPLVPVVFAVVGRCSFDPSVTVDDTMTATTAHELVESATDPLFVTAPAYASVDDAHAFWMEITGGGEVGDLCDQDPSDFVTPLDVGHLVQRTWSNASAASGHDPCVPAPARPYFNVDADAPDVFYDPYAGVNVHGVAIPHGHSRTIDVRLYSDTPTAPWQLAAVDPTAASGGKPLLKLSLDETTGNNGDVVHLTIEPLFEGTDVTALYEIDSTAPGGAMAGAGATQRWYGEIVVR
jgi:hypothetical protein